MAPDAAMVADAVELGAAISRRGAALAGARGTLRAALPKPFPEASLALALPVRALMATWRDSACAQSPTCSWRSFSWCKAHTSPSPDSEWAIPGGISIEPMSTSPAASMPVPGP